MKPSKLLSVFFLIHGLVVASEALADEAGCGSFVPADGIGPWDYYDSLNWRPIPGSKFGSRIDIVEKAHFPRKVENLIEGRTGKLEMDLDYTLKRIPNHPRALWSISRFEREGRPHVKQNDPKYSARCYFDRAIRFRPKTPSTHKLYAIHLHLSGKYKSAEKEYKIAESLTPGDSELQYNMGLLYYDTKQYEKAKSYAAKAYENKYPLPGLKEKLQKVGFWP